ncbi:MAG: hypothetical protein EXS14_06645 [Planctomycetes bacterium]|nr:hypothetical protein [Planctomycetota bacterium]
MRASLLLLALLAGLAACTDETPKQALPPPRIWSGEDVTMPLPQLQGPLAPLGPRAPQRIVSLIPSATELVCVLGLEDRLVGRSRWCDSPESIRQLPDLGGLQDFQAERIADLKPDLVLLFDTLPSLEKTLSEEFHIQCVTPRTEREDQVFDGLRTSAHALDAAARGEALISALQQQLQEVEHQNASGPHPTVLVVLDRSPPFAACPGSFVDLLVRAAGGRNAVRIPPLERPWCALSAETIIDLAPDVIVDLSIGEDADDALKAGEAYWSTFPTLPAVRTGRVHLLKAPALARPGPRIVEAARLLARIIHTQ